MVRMNQEVRAFEDRGTILIAAAEAEAIET
jgi:hypothetical protein